MLVIKSSNCSALPCSLVIFLNNLCLVVDIVDTALLVKTEILEEPKPNLTNIQTWYSCSDNLQKEYRRRKHTVYARQCSINGRWPTRKQTQQEQKDIDKALHGAKVLFPKIDGKFSCAQEIIAHTMIRRDTELLDGSTMLLGRITLITLPIILRILFG